MKCCLLVVMELLTHELTETTVITTCTRPAQDRDHSSRVERGAHEAPPLAEELLAESESSFFRIMATGSYICTFKKH